MNKNKEKYKECMKWLYRYSKPHIPKILLLLLLDLLASVIGLGLVIITKVVIDNAYKGDVILSAVLLYLLIVVVNQLITIVSSITSAKINEKFSFSIRKQLYEKIIRSNWGEINKYHTGDLMTRLTSDAGNIADGIVLTIPTMLRLFFELVITFCTLFYFSPLLAIFALVLGPIVVLTSIWFGKHLHRLQVKVQESEAAYRSYLQESLSNLLVVKSFTNEEYAIERLVKLRDERFYWVFKKNKLAILSSSIISLSFSVGYIGAFTIGAFQIARNIITYGTMSVFLTLVNRIQAPIYAMAQSVPKLVSVITSIGRIIELQDIPIEEVTGGNMEHDKIGLQVNNMTFGYTKENVLENVSLEIKPGEVTGVVGESGIGKTTLIRLIMSLVKGRKGNIIFNNESGESEESNAGSRKYISYVPQGNTLFSGTIIENIKMGNQEATEEEIKKALEVADAYEFVQELPQGINTVIGERGHGLSEGQAQRIAIARALIKNAPVLILDEATSALDEFTELKVLQGIQSIQPKPACLLITHRKSALDYCDHKIKILDKKLYYE